MIERVVMMPSFGLLNRNSISGLSGKGEGLRVRVCDTAYTAKLRIKSEKALSFSVESFFEWYDVD